MSFHDNLATWKRGGGFQHQNFAQEVQLPFIDIIILVNHHGLQLGGSQLGGYYFWFTISDSDSLTISHFFGYNWVVQPPPIQDIPTWKEFLSEIVAIQSHQY